MGWFTIHTCDEDIDEESMSHDGMRVIKLPRVSDSWADDMHEAVKRLEDTLDRVARECAMVEAYLADHPDEYARIDMLASSPDPKARMLAYDMMDDIRSMVSRRREGGHAGSPRGLDWGN